MDYMHARSMEHYQKLTEAERMVIDYILSTEKIESLRLQQIREALFVSNATVVRACKKMNFATFNELKYAVIHKKNKRAHVTNTSDFFSRIENIKTATLKTLDSLEEKKSNNFVVV